MKSTYIAAIRDLIIAAASGIVVGSWMTGMTPFMSQRACEFYDVELKRCQEFDRHAEGER